MKNTKKMLTTKYVEREYDRQIRDIYKGNYEYERWFSTPEARLGFKMHESSQKFHTKDIKFRNYLEFGVGSGIWTRMFLNKKKHFTLIDISKEMLGQAKKNLGFMKNISYIQLNILNLKAFDKYDMIFSSRVIKYVPDKEKMFSLLYRALKKDGSCVIINQSIDTVMQRIYHFLGIKSKDLLHSRPISIKDLKFILKNAGFKDIRFYPVEIKVGIPGITIFKKLSLMIWKKLYKKKLNWISTLLAGSYLMKMKK